METPEVPKIEDKATKESAKSSMIVPKKVPTPVLEKKKALKYSGLDLINGKPRNNLAFGVIEPTMSKVKSLKFATEAAITILPASKQSNQIFNSKSYILNQFK
jgi:chaperonin GroEL (HSP60 family)